MTGCACFRTLVFSVALTAVSTAVSVPIVQAAPPGNCPGGSQQEEHCLPGGPGSPPAGPGGPIHPPVTPPVPPPGTPPVVPPTSPPSGRPQATRPQDPELPLFVIGLAKATLHIYDADRDIVYTSSEVPLTFMRRIGTDKPGQTEYILAPVQGINQAPGEDGRKLQMIWTVEGREFDCTVKGKAIVTFPAAPGGGMYLDPTDDPTQPAYGYLNVVGPDGGDFHSVMIKAVNPDADYTKTCPGDPPIVTKEPFKAVYLLHILSQPNTREDGRVIFQGHQEYDQGDPLDFLNLLPPGAAIPEEARRALQTQGSSTRGSCSLSP